MDYGHAHQRDVYWTKHALHRIEQTGGNLDFMFEIFKKAPAVTLKRKALAKKHKYGPDQQAFVFYWDSIYRTLFTCKKENGKLVVITVTQK